MSSCSSSSCGHLLAPLKSSSSPAFISDYVSVEKKDPPESPQLAPGLPLTLAAKQSMRSVTPANRGKKLVIEKPTNYTKPAFDPVDRSFLVNGALPNIQRHIRNLVVTSQQHFYQETAFVTSAAVPTFAGYTFLASTADNFSNMSSVFDQYRIDLVEVWACPRVTDWVTQGGAGMGTLVSCVDQDDSNTPTTLANLQSYQSAIVSNGSTGHYHRFKPHVAIACYSGAFTSFANETSPWIDCGSPSVQHYGFKMGSSATAAQTGIEIYVRLTISYRGIH